MTNLQEKCMEDPVIVPLYLTTPQKRSVVEMYGRGPDPHTRPTPIDDSFAEYGGRMIRDAIDRSIIESIFSACGIPPSLFIVREDNFGFTPESVIDVKGTVMRDVPPRLFQDTNE